MSTGLQKYQTLNVARLMYVSTLYSLSNKFLFYTHNISKDYSYSSTNL